MPAKTKGFFIAGAAVLGYVILNRLTGFSIPCCFRYITGFRCPGCGITRVIYGYITLDISDAYKANPFITITSPFLIFELIYIFFMPHRDGTFDRINGIFLCLYISLLIIYGVIRNAALLESRFSISLPEILRFWSD
ncbi:MAG: DUF2752 domain-containing protein [Lachnospiraceae bacterium]|nr:DUF2752 domain-containing protein [Lachnospiraceae bacterium]